MEKMVTKTISLPKALAERVRRVSAAEQRTTSELFREAFRLYESRGDKRITAADWKRMRARLARVSRSGKRTSLTKFIRQDRDRH